MPRSPYFSGPIGSTGIVHSPGRVPDMLENPGALASAIGGAVGRMFYKRENDPDAQRADLYRVQAAREQSNLDAENAQRRAAGGLPAMMAAMTASPTNRHDVRPELGEGEVADPNDMRLTEAQHAEADMQDRRRALADGFGSLTAANYKPEDASTIMSMLAATMGMDTEMSRMRFAGHGTTLGENDAVSTVDREGVAARNDRQETAVKDAANETKIQQAITAATSRREVAEIGGDARRDSASITSGNALAGRKYASDNTYAASTQNNVRNNETSRANNTDDNVAADDRNTDDNAQSNTNNVRNNANRPRSRNSSRRDRDRTPAAAPAAPAAPARRRIVLDENGNRR